MLFSIAWKNVWRNKLRSIIVIISITVGLVGGLFYLAFSNGMVQNQISSSIETEISNIQIHNPQYLINNEIKFEIKSTKDIISKIQKIQEIEAIATRIKATGMISSAITGTGITISGINLDEEKRIADLHTKLVDGTYFETKLRNPILISKKLASKLNVKIGSRIVVTMQDMNENITYGAFKITGIFKTDDTTFDLFNTFVLKTDLAKLIDYKSNNATEIAILLKHNGFTDSVTSKIKNILSKEIEAEQITVRTWKEIQPILELLNNMTIQFTMIFVIIILVALSFGIVNTMLMAIMERVREIGMLMAIGMSRLKVFIMIMLETVFLSITGGLVGLITSWILISIFYKIGIDLSAVGEGLNSVGYSSFVRPELDFSYYIMIGLLVIITAMVASIFPARKALKLNPSEAVRQDV